MRLRNVRVRNFRSIKDSGNVLIDEHVTVLVGKNEAGKTNFLRALASFNSTYHYEHDDLCYYGETEPESKIPIITATFELNIQELNKPTDKVEALGEERTVEVTRYFDGTYSVQPKDALGATNLPSITEMAPTKQRVRQVLVNCRTWARELMPNDPPMANSVPVLENLINRLAQVSESIQLIELLKEASQIIRKLPVPSPRDQKKAESFAQLLDVLESDVKGREMKSQVCPLELPRFLNLASSEVLPDAVRVNDFLANKQKYKTLDNLCVLAGLDTEHLMGLNPHDRARLTRQASARITGKINNSWLQEKVGVRVAVDGDNLLVFVEDEEGGHDAPSHRSDGFQWFLAFYVNLSAGFQREFNNAIILLDGPGMNLHPAGQKDLTRTLDAIAQENQIILATHSPFLIDRERLDRIRIVSKKGMSIGTRISEKVPPSDFDSLDPIRAALGMSLGDALFASKRTVFVEGLSDCLILEGMSAICRKTGRPCFDFRDTAVLPSAGAAKLPYFIAFSHRQDLHCAVLLDSDSGGKSASKTLTEKYEFPASKIVFVGKILGMEDVETEDLIGLEFYNKAVNDSYARIFKNKDHDMVELNDVKGTLPRTRQYEDYFEKEGLGGFDKILVAREISKAISDESGTEEAIGAVTLDNFGKLFAKLNETLK